MKRTAFEKISNGLGEALEIAKGIRKPARLHIPCEVDVKAIRDKLALSQEDFAAEFGFTVHQVRQWEQGRNRPLGGVRAYLMMIEQDAGSVRTLLKAAVASRMAAA